MDGNVWRFLARQDMRTCAGVHTPVKVTLQRNNRKPEL